MKSITTDWPSDAKDSTHCEAHDAASAKRGTQHDAPSMGLRTKLLRILVVHTLAWALQV